MTKLPSTDTGACGTDRGYYRHITRDEETCPDCRKAHAASDLARKQAHREGRELAPKIREIAEEIDHLLYMRQGIGYILKAVNINSPIALARRLHRLGRHDLARHFETKENTAA